MITLKEALKLNKNELKTFKEELKALMEKYKVEIRAHTEWYDATVESIEISWTENTSNQEIEIQGSAIEAKDIKSPYLKHHHDA